MSERSAAGRPPSLRLNAAAGMLSNLAYFGVIFLVTPLAVRRLGAEGWGLWQLVGASALYAQLLNLSLGAALHYQVAFRTASGDLAGLAQALTSVRLYLAGAGVLLLGALAAFGHPFLATFVSPAQLALAWPAFVIALGLTALDLQTRLAGSVLVGLQRNDLYAVFQAGGALALGAAVWLGFEAGMQLRGFAAVMTCGPMFAALCSWGAYRRLLPRAALRLARPDWTLFRSMLGYSLSTLLYASGAVVLYQTMKLLASLRCGGAEAAGELGLAISLAQTLAVVFTPALGVLHARVGQLHGEQRLAEVAPLLERVLVGLGAVLVPGLVFLVLDARLVFEAWLGAAVSAAALDRIALSTRLLFIGHGLYLAALPFYYALLGVGEHRRFGAGMLAVAVVSSALGYAATGIVPRIETLAAVYGVSMLVLAGVVTLPAGLRRFPLPFGRVLVRAVLVPLACSLPGAALLVFRPRAGAPLLDLALDAAGFGLLALPGLEIARRHIGLPLGLRARGSAPGGSPPP